MTMGNLNLPPGFKFKPNDDELVTHYLKPKVLGQQLPCSAVIKDDIQLYGPNSTPWELFDISDSDSWIEHSVYVFTSLSKISATARPVRSRSRFNTNKKAGCGTWTQKTPRKPIKDGFGNVIGGKRMLVFVVNDGSVPIDSAQAVYFKMHEYSLWGVNEGLCASGDDLVICQITFDSSRRSIVKLASQKTDSVSKAFGEVQKNSENLKNHQGSVGSTSKSVTVVNTDVASVGDGEGSIGAVVDNNVVQGSDWFGGGLCFDGLADEGLCFDALLGDDPCLDSFDMDSFDIPELMQHLDSTPEEEVRDDRAIHMPGKRKLEERDGSYQAKKMRF